MSSNKYCVIMAGGIGTRFWPKSRQSMPKQFLDILGTGKSFIRHTYERFAKMVPAENFLVVTNDKYKSLVLEHIPEIGEKQVLCEPVGRNTAPCVAYAAYTLLKRNPDAEMIVTPADHLILNEDDFRAIIAECLDFASEHDALMTVGIKPTRPDTGYGYIQVSDDKPISKVKCFTEKPDIELARVFLQSGEFYWNSGIFVWKVRSIVEAFEKYLPEHHALISGGMGAVARRSARVSPAARCAADLPARGEGRDAFHARSGRTERVEGAAGDVQDPHQLVLRLSRIFAGDVQRLRPCRAGHGARAGDPDHDARFPDLVGRECP